MHTTSGPNVHFHHNGDFSGDVWFTLPTEALTDPANADLVTDGLKVHLAAPFPLLAQAALEATEAGVDTATVTVRHRDYRSAGPRPVPYEVRIPTEDLRVLVGERIERERVAALEGASYDALFELGRHLEAAAWAAEPVVWAR